MKTILKANDLIINKIYVINKTHKNYKAYSKEVGEEMLKNGLICIKISNYFCGFRLSNGIDYALLFEPNKFVEVNKLKYLQFIK